jgi:hypothetical protein
LDDAPTWWNSSANHAWLSLGGLFVVASVSAFDR